MEFENMCGKGISVKIHSYTEEDTKIFNQLLEVLFINMYGEAQRTGAIEIEVFNPNNIPSRLAMDIALKVAGIYNLKVGIKCKNIFRYLKTKFIYKDLFKKHRIIYRVKHNCRPVYEWLGDITNARSLEYDTWLRVWEYMND